MRPYALGVDIGGTTVKIGLFSTAGKFLDHWEIPTRKEKHGALILPDIAASIDDKLKELDISHEDLEGIGVGRQVGSQRVGAPRDQITVHVGGDPRIFG